MTQFIGSPLREIKRFYGKSPFLTYPSYSGRVEQELTASLVQDTVKTPSQSILSSQTCAVQKDTFGEPNTFANLGGLHAITNAFETTGMVLALGINDDPKEYNLRIDGTWPLDAVGFPGTERGPCVLPGNGGGATLPVVPDLDQIKVKIGDIRVGKLGSTF